MCGAYGEITIANGSKDGTRMTILSRQFIHTNHKLETEVLKENPSISSATLDGFV
jgi:hypothetical protein